MTNPIYAKADTASGKVVLYVGGRPYGISQEDALELSESIMVASGLDTNARDILPPNARENDQ